MEIRTKKMIFSSYLKLSKLRVVELLLVTTVPAMIVSIYSFPPIKLILFTLIGGTMLAVSANVLNQIFEIEQDRLMSRTSNRPLVTGEISVKNAFVFSIFIGSLGFSILYIFTTALASFIALSANIFRISMTLTFFPTVFNPSRITANKHSPFPSFSTMP